MTRTGEIIRQGLEHLGLEADDGLADRLANYIDLLIRWNRTYNLTAINDPADVAVNHVLDSLSVASLLVDLDDDSSIVDVGSGAGLPGIPLAMYFPRLQFLLLDSSGKKTRFLTQARIDLELVNVEVHKGRAEAYEEKFDRVVCRAFASLAGITSMMAHLLKPRGRILAMKGKLSDEELSVTLLNGLSIARIEKIVVPFLDADRHIVVMERGK